MTKDKTEEKETEAAPTETEAAKTEEKTQDTEKTPTEAPKAEQKLRLADAAKRFVDGFREDHMASIKRFAATQNFSEPATVAECKQVLRAWGAKLK